MNTTWYLPYGDPTKDTTILNDDIFLHDDLTPLFNNIHHPYNPQYDSKNIIEANHNMLEGQPIYQKDNFLDKYINAPPIEPPNKSGLLSDSNMLKANIHWDNSLSLSPTQQSNQDDFSYHPYKIDPDFRALPDGKKHFKNPNIISGTLSNIVPWDSFNNPEDDEYFNERNFQKIYNHPFYQQVKPMLEQPFKNL